MKENTIYKSCFLPHCGEYTTTYWWQDKLVGLLLGDEAHDAFERVLMHRCGAAAITDCSRNDLTETMGRLEQELTAYYGGALTDFTVPITLLGTPFQMKIWQALLGVPYGCTTSYSQLAADAGVHGARATGSAVGSNPIAIVVPCHRVLPKSGKLGNYSTGRGVDTKRDLLSLEAVNSKGGVTAWK